MWNSEKKIGPAAIGRSSWAGWWAENLMIFTFESLNLTKTEIEVFSNLHGLNLFSKSTDKIRNMLCKYLSGFIE